MTFTEAALEVLRTAGEPLHYKRITELAIERNLLSHVGKTPEVTMSSRLAMMVKKDRGQAPIIKVKPGVFAIRESALEDMSAAVAAAAALEAEAAASSEEPSEGAVQAPAEKPPALPGADVFPEEEGDDDPILAGLEQDGEGGDRSGRRRRRRRRRGKGGDKPDNGAPEPVRAEGGRDGNRDQPRDSGRDRERHRDHGRERDRDRDRDRPREAREQGRDFGRDRPREEAPQLDWHRQPGDGDLLGRDLADAVWLVLSRGEHAPHTFARVAELLVRRGRMSGSPAALAPTIAAAVRADISRAELSHARPRFRLRQGRLSLSEWLLPKPLARAEQDLLAASERHGNELRRALIHKLGDLPAAGFAELVATWLNAEGVTSLRALRRPGSSISEFHFAGTLKRGSEETRLAIVVARGSRDLDRETIVAVRGALHHYGQAQSVWIITTGRFTSGAREEAAMQTTAPCALFDGMAVATAMERIGIAVRSYVIAHHEIDYDLLEALGDGTQAREQSEGGRGDRERGERGDRERGERGGRDRGSREARPSREERGDQTRRVATTESEPAPLEDESSEPAASPDAEVDSSEDALAAHDEDAANDEASGEVDVELDEQAAEPPDDSDDDSDDDDSDDDDSDDDDSDDDDSDDDDSDDDDSDDDDSDDDDK